MGGGYWDTKLYASSASLRASKNIEDFTYHANLRDHIPHSKWKSHDDLNPITIKDSANHARESRDSKEHPTTTAVMMFFDVTGSMRGVPMIFQKNLPKLMLTLLMKGGLNDPQILMGAVGDVTCDSVPMQISQFESDNRVDDHLRKIVLEGGGGDGKHESYELVLYFAARLTSMDCLEKRGKKGYLFISGDEVPYDKVSKDAVNKVFGTGEQSDISLQDIFDEAMTKFDIYFIIPKGTNHWGNAYIEDTWKKYIGQNVLKLEDPNTICELVASTIAVNEGTDIKDIATSLVTIGVDSKAVSVVSQALATYKATGGGKEVAKTTGTLPKSSRKDTLKTV